MSVCARPRAFSPSRCEDIYDRRSEAHPLAGRPSCELFDAAYDSRPPRGRNRSQSPRRTSSPALAQRRWRSSPTSRLDWEDGGGCGGVGGPPNGAYSNGGGEGGGEGGDGLQGPQGQDIARAASLPARGGLQGLSALFSSSRGRRGEGEPGDASHNRRSSLSSFSAIFSGGRLQGEGAPAAGAAAAGEGDSRRSREGLGRLGGLSAIFGCAANGDDSVAGGADNESEGGGGHSRSWRRRASLSALFRRGEPACSGPLRAVSGPAPA